jgi:hypothetical protein
MRSRFTNARSARWPLALSVAAVVTLTAWAPSTLSQQSGDKGGSFSIQPETITFGKTPLFFKRTDTFVVRNHGKSAVRNVRAELTGGNEKVFSLENGCGDSLAPGQQCEIKVGFEPTSDGDKSAELRITAGNEAVRTRRVTGSGVAAKYTATPKSLAFGKVANGTTSKEQVVTITNTGDVALPITATSLGGQNEKQFAQSNDCPRELAIGKSCKSTVRFRPTWNGEHQATLTVWAKGGAPETQVALTGSGTGGRDEQQQQQQKQKSSGG